MMVQWAQSAGGGGGSAGTKAGGGAPMTQNEWFRSKAYANMVAKGDTAGIKAMGAKLSAAPPKKAEFTGKNAGMLAARAKAERFVNAGNARRLRAARAAG